MLNTAWCSLGMYMQIPTHCVELSKGMCKLSLVFAGYVHIKLHLLLLCRLHFCHLCDLFVLCDIFVSIFLVMMSLLLVMMSLLLVMMSLLLAMMSLLLARMSLLLVMMSILLIMILDHTC